MTQHLDVHRRLILSGAVGSALAGAVPLPFVDDWLAVSLRRAVIRRVADARGVDVDEKAVRAIAEGTVPGPGWRTLLGATRLGRFLRRPFRMFLLVATSGMRASEAGRWFAMAMLFDHYCARLHVGPGLDRDQARRLRSAIEETVDAAAAGGIFGHLFRRSFVRGLRAPLGLVDRLAGDGGREPPLVKATRALDRRLSGADQGYIDRLVAEFERTWAARK